MANELVIASDEACSLASELAYLRGDSLEGALLEALRAGVEREYARLARQERIMAITRDIARSSRYAEARHAMAG